MVITIIIVSTANGNEFIIVPNRFASHNAAPVSLIFDPNEIVAPNNKITPQCVFLLKSSHFTKPATKYRNTPNKAIVPRP